VGSYNLVNGYPNTNYFLTDHLGSVVATANAAGMVTNNGYDAHGKRRNANGTDAPITTFLTGARRGYTGHEHDDEVGLVNMNAREYDYVLGRFITPDAVVPGAFNSQSYNRYSYVNNNPLSRIDPSGRWSISIGGISIGSSGISISLGGIGCLGCDKVVKQATQQVARSTTYVLQKVGGIPYVGGLMNVGLLTSPGFGPFYGASTGDWRTVGQAHATGAVLAAGAWAAPGIAAMPWYSSLGASTALGYTSGYTIAQIYGGSNAQASAAGRTSARYAGVVSLLYMGAMEMREQMVAQSKIPLPDGSTPNATGISDGFRGDGFKLGGARCIAGGGCPSNLLGGVQGGQGTFFGFEYQPGSFRDWLVEVSGGPHDFLNSFMYNQSGNLNPAYASGIGGVFGEAVSWFNVAPAAVFATGSVLQPLLPYAYPLDIEQR
jgi:RHS repeat-associated protein